MKFCYNTNSTLPKQCQSSRSVLQDGSRTFGLFWKEKNPSYNRRNTVTHNTPFRKMHYPPPHPTHIFGHFMFSRINTISYNHGQLFTLSGSRSDGCLLNECTNR